MSENSLVDLTPMVLWLLLTLALGHPTVQGLQGGQLHCSRHALLIGAWDYGEAETAKNQSPRWRNLPWARNNVAVLRRVLDEHFHWTSLGGEIKTLTTREETTRASILAAIGDLAKDVREGDTFFISYSGHGYLTPDVDPTAYPKDVLKWAPINPIVGNGPGGLDPTLLPTDDPAMDANQIRGDELGVLIEKIKEAAGGKKINIFLSMDCCHSGSNTRAPEVGPVAGRNYDGPTNYTSPKTPPNDPLWRITRPSGYTVFQACQTDQEARADDSQGAGRFTWALATSLTRCDTATSYRQLFEMVDAYMTSHYTFGDVSLSSQNPAFDGDMNRTVLGAAATGIPDGYSVKPLDTSGKITYRLTAGQLDDILTGDTVRLYRFGSDPKASDATSFAKAIVGAVDITESTLEFPGGAPDPKLMDRAIAAVESKGVQSNRLSIDLSAIAGEGGYGEIRASIAALRIAKLVEETGAKADFAVVPAARVPNSGKDGFVIVRLETGDLVKPIGSTGPELNIPPGDDAADRIASTIEREAKSRAFYRLQNEFPGQGAFVEIRISRCDQNGDPINFRTTADAISSRFQVGDHAVIEYRVHGDWGEGADPYVGIVDLTTDREPKLLWPDGDQPVQLERRTSWTTLARAGERKPMVLHARLPYGSFVLKVIASQRPVNYGEIISEVPSATRDQLTPLGLLIDDFFENNERDQGPSDPGEIWSTRSTKYEVVEPK